MSADAAARRLAQVARELDLPKPKVAAVLTLLDDKNTVPFIARYRKEATGGLDEVQIRAIDERRAYVVELHRRREQVIATIDEQGKLSPELRKALLACQTKSELEDLYLPFRPKRRTRATVARERGLSGLAQRILEQPRSGDPEREARALVDPENGLPDGAAALAGARDIVAEVAAEHAQARALTRQTFMNDGVLLARPVKKDAGPPGKYDQYHDHAEPVATIPSHRFLAIRRGEREGALRSTIEVDSDRLVRQILRLLGHAPRSPFARHMELAVEDGLRRLLAPSIDKEVRAAIKERSDRKAVHVFAANLRDLLLAAPLGGKPVLGIDPGLRTGCKCTAVDATGKLLAHTTIYPHTAGGRGGKDRAGRDLLALVRRLGPSAVAVGNGTGGRETEQLVREVLREAGLADVVVVSVNEAGASVYSASDLARNELPDLDISVRGAISIARRLQDPLAELVKIDPKSIGVGQYQHDVNQTKLRKALDREVESCVNLVGVDLNSASVQLLSYVSGIGPKLAEGILQVRNAQGAFSGREALRAVPRLGNKAFQQSAGFLRVRGGTQPLDNSAVHPESYYLVEKMAQAVGARPEALVGNRELVQRLSPADFVDERAGLPTIQDILGELEKPGRDPRREFRAPKFAEGVDEITDLREGMILEGVVTNVTRFGAFVDVGVHQDGLVHISELDRRFVKDPTEVVAVGDILRVRVLQVDPERRRIALSRKQALP